MISYFWLILIEEEYVTVSLFSSGEPSKVVAVGSRISYDPSKDDIMQKIDISLTECLNLSKIEPSQEPDVAAFCLPAFWVGSDGKIISSKLNELKEVCKNFAFRPIGFISDDDAFLEYKNSQDGIPGSYILVHLSKQSLRISLAFLGKINNKIKVTIDPSDSKSIPEVIDQNLFQISNQNTLPPKLIIWGDYDDYTKKQFYDYAWLSREKKNNFLHSPEVEFLDFDQVISNFSNILTSQLSHDKSENQTKPDEKTQIDENQQESKDVDIQKKIIEKVTREEIGFSITTSLGDSQNQKPPKATQSRRIKINSFGLLKKITSYRPVLKFKFSLIVPLSIFSLILLISLLLYQVDISLYMSPSKFNDALKVELSSKLDSSDYESKKISVIQKDENTTITDTISTTGVALDGEKARGQILIYNKSNQVVSLKAGHLLKLKTTPALIFEINSSIQVPASTTNLSDGIISLGKIKTLAVAKNIGAESNLSKGSEMIVDNYSSDQMIAVVDEAFSGGNSTEIASVDSKDRELLSSRVSKKLDEYIENFKNTALDTSKNIIVDTLTIKKGKFEYSREVGEKANELSVGVDISISYQLFKDADISSFITKYLSQKIDSSKFQYDPSTFVYTYKSSSTAGSGSLQITGNVYDYLDVQSIRKKVTGKSQNTAREIIRNLSPQIYDININLKPVIFKNMPLLPLLNDKINIDLKTQK